MGGLTSRNKGKRGEREVVVMLQPVVNDVYEAFGLEPPRLQRNSLQSDGGGFDIVGLKWLALEVKYCETVKLAQWWQQTLDQCGQQQVPVLFYRRNNVEWKVRQLVTLQAGAQQLTVPAIVSLQDFLKWFRARLTEELCNEI